MKDILHKPVALPRAPFSFISLQFSCKLHLVAEKKKKRERQRQTDRERENVKKTGDCDGHTDVSRRSLV